MEWTRIWCGLAVSVLAAGCNQDEGLPGGTGMLGAADAQVPDFPVVDWLVLPSGPDAALPEGCPPAPPCHLPTARNPATGQCDYPLAPEGIACDDGNRCSADDQCTSGRCVGVTPVVCMKSACGAGGACDPIMGCPVAPQGDLCDDGNPCTRDERCRDGFCAGVPAFDETTTHCLPWRLGWDSKAQPLDTARSYVTWSVPARSRTLSLHYHIVGGRPNSRHVIGLANFAAGGACIDHLGQFHADGPCITWMREGAIAVNAVPIDGGSIGLDRLGTGDADLAFIDVEPGAYGVEFVVRAADWGMGCPDCDVIYQSPGPYTRTALIVIQ